MGNIFAKQNLIFDFNLMLPLFKRVRLWQSKTSTGCPNHMVQMKDDFSSFFATVKNLAADASNCKYSCIYYDILLIF